MRRPAARHVERAAMILAALTLAAALFFAGFAILDDSVWSPLGPYPEQTVAGTGTVEWESPEDGARITIPSVPVDGVAYVTGTKCSDENVVVAGDVRWTAVDPAGASFPAGAGIGERQIGCSTRTFDNEIPDDVAAWAQRRLDAGARFVVVRIGGCETPTKDEREGEQVCWRTEPFALTPAGTP